MDLTIIAPKDINTLREWAKHGKPREGDFKLFCGHKNGYQMPIYPFEWHCLECGQITKEIIKEVQK
jgi:hypothetical protein